MTLNKTSNRGDCHYLTLPQAAKALGIPASTLRRAESAGLIKSYQLFSARKRVVLSEVVTAIAAFGGQNNE